MNPKIKELLKNKDPNIIFFENINDNIFNADFIIELKYYYKNNAIDLLMDIYNQNPSDFKKKLQQALKNKDFNNCLRVFKLQNENDDEKEMFPALYIIDAMSREDIKKEDKKYNDLLNNIRNGNLLNVKEILSNNIDYEIHYSYEGSVLKELKKHGYFTNTSADKDCIANLVLNDMISKNPDVYHEIKNDLYLLTKKQDMAEKKYNFIKAIYNNSPQQVNDCLLQNDEKIDYLLVAQCLLLNINKMRLMKTSDDDNYKNYENNIGNILNLIITNFENYENLLDKINHINNVLNDKNEIKKYPFTIEIEDIVVMKNVLDENFKKQKKDDNYLGLINKIMESRKKQENNKKGCTPKPNNEKRNN